jgi:CubicO group peptidase (beta-lactamase class C family)
LPTSHPRRAAALIAIVATVGLGVGPGGRAGAAPTDDPYAWPVPKARVRAAVHDIDRMVERVQRRSGVPGIAVAIVDRGKVVAARGYGTTNTRDGRRVDADTAFEVASLSKPLGATVIARVADREQVEWTDPIVAHLPGFRLADPFVTAHVSIEDMYAHRSGLPDHAGDLLEDLGFDRATVLERLRLLPLGAFRGRGHRDAVGGPVAPPDLPPAGHGAHELALRRLRRRTEPCAAPRAGRAPLGRALHA